MVISTLGVVVGSTYILVLSGKVWEAGSWKL